MYNRNADRKITAGKEPYGRIRVWSVRRKNQAYEDSPEEEEEEEEEGEVDGVDEDAIDEKNVKNRYCNSRDGTEFDDVCGKDTTDSICQSQEVRWIIERGAIVSADVSPCGETLIVWMDHPTNELTPAVSDADASVREITTEKEGSGDCEQSALQGTAHSDVFQVLLRKLQRHSF